MTSVQISTGSIVRTPDGTIGEVDAVYPSADQAVVSYRDQEHPECGPWPYVLSALEAASPGDAALYRQRVIDARDALAAGLMSLGSTVGSI